MSYTTIIIFFLTCMVLVITELTVNKNHKAYLSIVVISMLYGIIVAFRSPLSPDTLSYIDFYQSINTKLLDMSASSFEVGFQFLSKLIKILVGENIELYFFSLVIINVAIILFALKELYNYSPNKNSDNNREHHFTSLPSIVDNKTMYVMPLIMYVSYFGFFYNAIAMRASLTLSSVFLVIIFIINKKIKKAALVFFLALLFHTTAILAIPVILVVFLGKRYSKTTYFFVLGLSSIIYYSQISYYFTNSIVNNLIDFFLKYSLYNRGFYKFSTYMQSSTIKLDSSIKFAYYLLIGAILLTAKIKDEVYYKFLNVYFVGLLVSSLIHSLDFTMRAIDYFIIYSFILMFMYVMSLKSILLKLAVFCGFVSCNLILFLRIMNANL